MLIRRADSLLLVVDIQQQLAPALTDGAAITANAVRLLTAAGKLGIPAFISEQYVRGLGPSLPEIRAAAVDAQFFEKTHFSCAAEAGVVDLLRASGRHQVVLCGSEAHVCVLQSAFGLQAAGFEVFLAADAAASRTPANRDAAIARMQAGGIRIATTEMVLFEWLECAATDEFRSLLPLIK